MSNPRKKSKLIILITIMILVIVITGVSYAYMSSVSNVSNQVNINFTMANSLYEITANQVGDNINISLSYDDMRSNSVSNSIAVNDSVNLSVNLSVNEPDSFVMCSYDIAWVWDSTDQYNGSSTNVPFTINDVTYPYEFSLKGTSVTTGDSSEFNYGANILNEMDLRDFNWKEENGKAGNYAYVVTDALIASGNTTPTITNWNFETKIYNIDTNQNYLFDHHYMAHLEVRNVQCNYYPENPGNKFSSVLMSKSTAGNQGAASDNIVDGNNYLVDYGRYQTRFIGPDPDNYVYFNCDDYTNQSSSTCETWRIIGIFDDASHGVDGTKLVKIMGPYVSGTRYANDDYGYEYNTSWYGLYFNLPYYIPGSYKYDGSIKDKNGNVIYTFSDIYLGDTNKDNIENSGVIKNETTRNMMTEFNIYLRSFSVDSIGEKQPAYMAYNEANFTGVIYSKMVGKVLTLEVSDYKFSTSGGLNNSRLYCINSYNPSWLSADCPVYSWIFNLHGFDRSSSNEFHTIGTMSSAVNNYGAMLCDISHRGDISCHHFPNRSQNDRFSPVVYLSNNVFVVGGDGTSSNPYQINFN